MHKLLPSLLFLVSGVLHAQLPIVGEIDYAFGASGTVSLPFSLSNTKQQRLLSVPMPDGDILVAGQIQHPTGQIALIRLDNEGQRDYQYGESGLIVLPVQGEIRDLQLTPEGHILVAGFEESDQNRDFVLFRLLATGKPDTLFGLGGKVNVDFGGWDIAERILLLPEGELLLGGTTYRDKVAARNFAFVKLNDRGLPDYQFGVKGRRTVDVGKEDQLKALTRDSKGNLIFAGNCRTDRFQEFAVGRLREDGQPDYSFHFSGYLHFRTGKEHDYCNGMTLLPDDRILLLGHSRPENGQGYDLVVVGLDAHGFVDDTFGEMGKITLDVGGLEYASAILPQADNRILVAGNTNHRPFLVRMMPNGKLDPTFGSGGVATYKLGGLSEDGPRHMSLQADGKILLASLLRDKPTLLRLHGNPVLENTEQALAFDMALRPENADTYAVLGFGSQFQLKAWLRPVAGPDIVADTLPLSAMKAVSPIKQFITQCAHISLGPQFRISLAWDNEWNEHYFLNNTFFQSVPEDCRLNLLIPHELKQKPMPTLAGSQKSPWVQRGLH